MPQRNEHSVEIAAPRERVFAWIAEPELMLRWIGGLKRFEPIDEGPAQGSRAIQVAEQAGRDWELESTITRYEPPAALDAELRHSAFETRVEYRLEERDGGTRVAARMESDFRLPGSRLVGGLVRRKAQSKLEDDLARLKQLVEAES